MSKAELLKKMLPGFIPLFIFIAADEIWGTRVGLIVAVVCGLAEMGWIGFREKRFDTFVLFDTALLVVLGGISIWLENDLFFKLKPGLVELILVGILGVSAFSGLNIVGLMSRRYLQGIEINEQQVKQMRLSLKYMFFLFLFHTGLVFYATFFMSKEAWAFISGGLFYIFFGVYFLFELFRQRLKRRVLANEEWLPLIDTEGRITGKAPRSVVHNGSKMLHPVVHMHVISKNKTLLLQKRSATKLIQPGKWDTAVGGHIAAGESLETALKREASEEIGLNNFSAKLLKVYKWDTDIESELIYLFVTYDKANFKANPDEVDELRFWTPGQIEKRLDTLELTPNLEHEFSILKSEGLI